jgi:hypothetical protein
MTSNAFKLGLPTDIPWKRICVTEDMIDERICDATLPPKWASSIAVFRYVPPEEYQEHDDYEVSYLKVAVSLTGFVPRDSEIEGRLDWDNMTSEEIAEVESLLNEYQPCTGAMVQISVSGENGGAVRAGRQPFFLDFEPKKRELYEMATDTMERSSRSLQTLNVGKSGRTTQSMEVLDIDMGYSISGSGEGSYAGTGGGMSAAYSQQGQWGTKQVGSHESGVVRTVDNSTERRETHAFTTQIAQLYHLLDSFHLGTNRALFLLEPRPHVVDQPSGFVRGPRPIDGVQEFFLVVAAPKGDPDYCVAVRLDTAHFTEEDVLEFERRQDSINLSVSVSPPAANDAQAAFTDYQYLDVTPGGDRRYKCYQKRVEDSENYIVADRHAGFKVDLAAGGGYTIVSQSNNRGGRSVQVTSDGERLTATVWATSRKCYDDGGAFCLNCPDTIQSHSANSSLNLVVNLISKEATRKVGTRKYLLVTTRGLCCCEGVEGGSIFIRPGIIGVAEVNDLIRRKGPQFGLTVPGGDYTVTSTGTARLADLTRAQTGGASEGGAVAQPGAQEEGMTAREANALGKLFRAELQETAASRSAASPTPVLLHDFFIDKLQRRLRARPAARQRMEEVADALPVSDRARKALTKSLNVDQLRRRDVLSLPSEQVAEAAGLDPVAAAELRLAAAGVPLKEGSRTAAKKDVKPNGKAGRGKRKP